MRMGVRLCAGFLVWVFLVMLFAGLLVLLPNPTSELPACSDAIETFMVRVSSADGMAYSANFAGGSGKPKPPSEYLRLSGLEVKLMKSDAAKVTSECGIEL